MLLIRKNNHQLYQQNTGVAKSGLYILFVAQLEKNIFPFEVNPEISSFGRKAPETAYFREIFPPPQTGEELGEGINRTYTPGQPFPARH